MHSIMVPFSHQRRMLFALMFLNTLIGIDLWANSAARFARQPVVVVRLPLARTLNLSVRLASDSGWAFMYAAPYVASWHSRTVVVRIWTFDATARRLLKQASFRLSLRLLTAVVLGMMLTLSTAIVAFQRLGRLLPRSSSAGADYPRVRSA